MNSKFFNKRKFPSIILLPILLALLFSITTFAQSSELSLVDIFTALRSNKATLQQKNQLLIEGIRQRGITFALSKSLEDELRTAGADDTLIEAIRLKIPVPAEKPKVEPTPKPEPTTKPLDFAYYRNEGNSSYVLGNYDSAIKHYTEAIKLNEEDSNLFFSRGLAYYNKKKFLLAADDFTKVTKLKPEEPMAFYNRGNALKEIGKFEEALADYKKAAELDPENSSPQNAFQKLEADLKATTPNTAATSAVEKPENNDKTPPPIENPKPKAPVNIGSLQDLAKKLISPIYPSIEREIGVEGVVTVRVTINEKGKVISAEAISGPKGLRKVSEIAAKRSKFKPYLVDNVAVKASGYINYNFKK